MDLILLTYALLLLAGGATGYYIAGSLPSLVMGTGTALLVGILGFLKSNYAHSAALVITLLLTGFFGYRFALTGKFMPAGMMALASAAVFILQLRKSCCKLEA